MAAPGDYHHGQSPKTQTTNRPHNSAPAPAPFPLHHSNHHPRVPPPSPGSTELPSISTALNSASKYYDPTSDNGDRSVRRYENHYSPQVSSLTFSFPIPITWSCQHVFQQGCKADLRAHQSRDPLVYPDARPPESPYERAYHSPIAANFAHHSPLQRPPSQRRTSGGMEAMSHSPVSPTVYQSLNRGAVQPPPPEYQRRPSVKEEVSGLAYLGSHAREYVSNCEIR